MADSVYTKSIINSVYSKLNTASNAKCKSRSPDDQLKYQICSNQIMADNARILVTRLRGQISGCTKSADPRNCVFSINKLIKYLEKKQNRYEHSVDQLKNLEG